VQLLLESSRTLIVRFGCSHFSKGEYLMVKMIDIEKAIRDLSEVSGKNYFSCRDLNDTQYHLAVQDREQNGIRARKVTAPLPKPRLLAFIQRLTAEYKRKAVMHVPVDRFTPMAIIQAIDTMRSGLREAVNQCPQHLTPERWEDKIDGMHLALAWMHSTILAMAFDPERHVEGN
jgi:hypothetical protein